MGLTGPIAAGKNSVAEFFVQKGWFVIDADKKAHPVLESLKEKILFEFQSEAKKRNILLLNKDNSLNRKNLAKIVFSNKSLLKRHENLVYPAIDHVLCTEIANSPNENIVINAAMLYKSVLAKECSSIIYVDAPFWTRIFRCKKRDNLSFLQIFKVFLQQRHLFAQYLKLNVDIYRVGNIGNFIQLEDKVLPIISKTS
ncbi:MAG: dephospho-CoA kinase [Treponemataceae bacterium]